MVSIILPTYNESENITGLIEGIFSQVKQPCEIIVVDDDSPDLTWKIAQDLKNPGVKAIRRIGQRGLATAIDRGLRESQGDIVGWMDADMSMPASLIPGLIVALSDSDIAIGSRYVKGAGDKRSSMRVLTSRIINWFAGLLLGFGIKDYDSGFIVLKKNVFAKVPFPAHGYGDYFIEFIFKAKRAGFRIKEIPYVFSDRSKGVSKTAPGAFAFFKLGLGYIARIISIRFSG